MSRTTQTLPAGLALLSLLGIALAGCAAPSDDDDQTALRQELERLENEIGRLEFRIYQLENAVLPTGNEAGTSTAPAAKSAPAVQPAPAAAGGRYDLTPVD